MNEKIYLSLAHMGGKEQQFIKDAFDTNWVAPLGPNVNDFETDLASYIGKNRQVVALSSGTAAIHLGLLQLGVGPGDEVICQSFTFSASANPIEYLGAVPVFVDSETDTWNMDPELLEIAIKDRIKQTGKKPKAIIPVHLYGMPAKMDEIIDISTRYQIPILEDTAEALGSEYNQQKCGTFGEFACLSFNGNKIITTSGGGALICISDKSTLKTKYYATQARDDVPYYQHTEIGYNYRMSNVCAGIGRGQMLVLQDHVDIRREINTFYRKELASIKGITFQNEPDIRFKSNFWLTTILIDPAFTGGKTNDDLRLALENENIESRLLWKPMHLQPVFADRPKYENGNSEKLFNQGLCLPSSSILTEEDLYKVVKSIKQFFSKEKVLLKYFRTKDIMNSVVG